MDTDERGQTPSATQGEPSLSEGLHPTIPALDANKGTDTPMQEGYVIPEQGIHPILSKGGGANVDQESERSSSDEEVEGLDEDWDEPTQKPRLSARIEALRDRAEVSGQPSRQEPSAHPRQK